MQIASSKTREQFPLSTKKVIKKTISGTLGYVILLGILYSQETGVSLATRGNDWAKANACCATLRRIALCVIPIL